MYPLIEFSGLFLCPKNFLIFFEKGGSFWAFNVAVGKCGAKPQRTLTIEYTFIRCNVYVRSKNDHRHRQSHTQNEQIKKKQSIDCFLFMLLIILRAEPWTAYSEP